MKAHTSVATFNFTPEDQENPYYRAMLHVVGLGSPESGSFRLFFNHGRRALIEDVTIYLGVPRTDAKRLAAWDLWVFDLDVLGSVEQVADDVTTWRLVFGWKGSPEGSEARHSECLLAIRYNASSPPNSNLVLWGLSEPPELRRIGPNALGLRLSFRVPNEEHAFPPGRGTVTAVLRD